MRGVRKSKKVTWASDVNLRQIRLFLSEESPLQVGFGAEEHLQAKISFVPHSNGAAGDDFLPPGFEGPHSSNDLQIDLSEIPVIKWRCPFRFVLDLNWQVVAGEESKEPEVQNQGELRMLEAVYPRPSAIPTNPSEPNGIGLGPSSKQVQFLVFVQFHLHLLWDFLKRVQTITRTSFSSMEENGKNKDQLRCSVADTISS